ncbi:MAG: hypothetical protein HY721_17280 [Planctomycetes bacterium]|nr:hypothetical protein [Planctomycetota bacterium]
MTHRWHHGVVLAGCALVLVSPAAVLAGDGFPDFDLRAECPGRAGGEPGETVTIPGRVVLATTPEEGGGTLGARAWSLSLKPRGCTIVAAGTAGTAGALVPVGHRRADGYEKTEVTTGPDNEGAVSAVILSFVEDVSLPGAGEATHLVFDVQCAVPLAGELGASVGFEDGLVGSGQPVKNIITFGEGFTRRDDGGPQDHDADASEPCTFAVSPGIVLVRGDVNSDGSVNVTDAVAVLAHLFRGELAPACWLAADADASGAVDVSDVVQVLVHLFQGGPPPAPPFPDCGAVEAPASLCREPPAC